MIIGEQDGKCLDCRDDIRLGFKEPDCIDFLNGQCKFKLDIFEALKKRNEVIHEHNRQD
jgi:hypothetical protein